MFKIHRLRDQNLLRHNAIQEVIGDKAILISDSIELLQLIKISLFSLRKNYVVHALELYSVSYGACRSEYQYRWSLIPKIKYLLLKSYCGYAFAILRVSLLRNLAKKCGLMFISSDLRKQYLINEGVGFSIFVVKNKPVFSLGQKNTSDICRKPGIVLIGNMYSMKEDFINIVNFVVSQNVPLHCYGLSADDETWLRNMEFSNVEIFNRVDQSAISEILKTSKFALCLYSNVSINNIYSSSSKIFEMLYYGVIPVISNNQGLEDELNSLGANFIRIDDVSVKYSQVSNNDLLMYSEACHFSSERNTLIGHIKDFYEVDINS